MKRIYYLLICLFFVYSCENKKIQNEYTADDYYNQGLADYCNGNYSESLKNYNMAISIDSTVSAYYLNRGATKDFMNDTIGQLVLAKEYLEKAKALGNKDAEEELKHFNFVTIHK
jgi:tetratricopeptide (TPR) repeat protein